MVIINLKGGSIHKPSLWLCKFNETGIYLILAPSNILKNLNFIDL